MDEFFKQLNHRTWAVKSIDETVRVKKDVEVHHGERERERKREEEREKKEIIKNRFLTV